MEGKGRAKEWKGEGMEGRRDGGRKGKNRREGQEEEMEGRAEE